MPKTTLLFSIAAIACIAKFQPIQPVLVMGPSMQPTFHNLQCVLATKNFDTLRRGDVVVFHLDSGSFVKRVAYLPGDQVTEYRRLTGWYVPATKDEVRGYDDMRAEKRKRTVPPGTIYVIGDNVEDSTDSREFGPVPMENVVAKVLLEDGGLPTVAHAKMARRTMIHRAEEGEWI